MRGALALATALVLVPGALRAEGDDEEEATGDEEEDQVVVPDDKPAPKPKKQEFKKQDLRGHAVDAEAQKNVFLKDRFFADKLDSKKTSKGTLVQGSLQTSTFGYTESGGAFTTAPGLGDAGSKYSRFFGEARLQTDFRHIGGGNWDARIDGRARMVATPDATSLFTVTPTRIQSGFNGTNEYELREAWIVRSGKRSDVFIGRQFIPDLGAIKIDGLRIDYAKSEKFTLIGFGGLYPVRGSRSLTTDYVTLKDANQNDAGRFVASGGFGAAYRTLNTHGALGGVVIYPPPSSDETPRVYGTANGYYRSGAKVDLYHNVILDVVGSAGFALTNLSAGVNFKPNQRLRLTASINHVDTETLNVQANAFLSSPDTDAVNGGGTKVQNETFIRRLSTNQARGGVSAGLGSLQRFEVSTAVSFRYRPEVTLTAADNMTQVTLDAAQGVDVFFSLMDRRSLGGFRLGVDGSKSFAVGDIAFQRSEVLALRLFGAREFQAGKGEVEVEVGYASTKDKGGETACSTASPNQCFGTSEGTILSLGGNAFYRLSQNWLGLASLFLNRQAITRNDVATGMQEDPTITGLTGFLRVSYRF